MNLSWTFQELFSVVDVMAVYSSIIICTLLFYFSNRPEVVVMATSATVTLYLGALRFYQIPYQAVRLLSKWMQLLNLNVNLT